MTDLSLRQRGRRVLIVGILLVAPFPVPAFAEHHHGRSLRFFHNHFGTVGLLQTPTARMAETGDFSFTYSQFDPYTNYAFSFQPFDWFEAGFRYTSIDNRSFGSVAPDRDFLDKGVDLKLRLSDESHYRPSVAVGFRDFGGTGLFGSEYLVANKRWYDFDVSLGIGWGYLASRGDIANPLTPLAERFRERERDSGTGGGDFNLNQLFAGKAALFGGVQYQTPFEPLVLQLEYEGNDYQSEPLGNDQDQESPINIGARFRVNKYLTLSAALERGNTAFFGATLNVNLAHLSQPKNDPAPVVPRAPRAEATRNWQGVAAQLNENAGIATTKIARVGDSMVLEGFPTRYRSIPETELRANRILHNAVGPDITSFRYRWKSGGMLMREDRVPRAPLPAEPILVGPGSPFSDADYRHAVVSRPATGQIPADDDEHTLFTSSVRGFSWNLGPDLNYNYGGPDGLLYQALARLDAEYDTDANGFFTGSLTYDVANNLENFDYVAPSQLPRVRTFVVNYLDETDLGIYNLQYTRTARLSDNWFGMAYAGLLEQQYGGAGGEVLYRPFNSPVALGLDINWVKQRAFDTQFDFRDYATTTGNLTAYVDTGFKNILAKVSVGRYLAKDIGTTLDFSREFESGVRLGAYATFTDAGDKFGEGSFNKGIYLSVPLDIFSTRSTRDTLPVSYTPLTRDGGAKLNRRFSLYSFTDKRDLGRYWENYEHALK